MENYFNYFTEVEERFQQRRGTGLLLSTLDWALIETWKDAGIPLEAVIRGIDSAFDRYDQRPTKTRKVNSLAYCAQEVLAAAEEMKEAAGGTVLQAESSSRVETGFELPRVAEFLRRNADQLQQAELPGNVRDLAMETACHLRRIAGDLENQGGRLEDLERRLSVMEEKVQASLLTSTADDEMVALRAEADRELAPYRRQMPGMQIDQLQKQFIHKRLMERYRIPRLSLFYL